MRDYRARKAVHDGRLRRLRRDNVLAVIGVVVFCGLAGVAQFQYLSNTGQLDPAASAAPETPAPSDPAATTDPVVTEGVPDASLAGGRSWTGSMAINGVKLDIELDGAAAPQAVSAFVYDAEQGYFPGKTCHRLTTSPGFEVLQCGSLNGDGAGDPSFQYGPIENAPDDQQYPAGTIAMARAGNDPNSNGHQFFIVYGDTTIPNDSVGGYTVIGKVTSGLDQLISSVTSLGTAADPADPSGVPPADGAPAVPVAIEAVSVQ